MADERGGYACLLDLCLAWAAEANAPKELILRRVIEWAVEGTFPPEFMTTTGDVVPPVKLLALFRAVYNPGHEAWPVHVAPTTVGSLTLRIHPDEALNFLADVVVSLECVQRFRDRMGVTTGDPPPACPRLAELEAADFAATTEAAAAKAEAIRSTRPQERRCQQWLEELMAEGKRPMKARDAYKKEAHGLFDVGSNAFRRAWDAAILATGNRHWSKPGRKS